MAGADRKSGLWNEVSTVVVDFCVRARAVTQANTHTHKYTHSLGGRRNVWSVLPVESERREMKRTNVLCRKIFWVIPSALLIDADKDALFSLSLT